MIKPVITGIITAAGFSERMGSFKPLNTFQGEYYVEAITKNILPFCSKVIIVTGFKGEEIADIIQQKFENDKVRLLFNPNYEKGMFTSLQKGISESHDSDWILYHFVDQPFFKQPFYRDFLNQINSASEWIQPSYNGRAGHPVSFNRKTAQKILNADPGSNLRMIKEDSSIIKTLWECNYPEILIDFDSPENITRYYDIIK